jgi:mono/diheme cytochrome c family protein
MAGGRAMQTPFGVIYSTNITPDPDTGIGSWTDDDFVNAMTKGIAPDGTHYFPAFPYTSFTRMKRQDVLDLKAYLRSIPPVQQANKPPAMPWPFRWRAAQAVWKWLYFTPGAFEPQRRRSAAWNRGAYLATAMAHCGECHTPRNLFGGLKRRMAYAGSVEGPDGQLAPNITPHETTGIGAWSIPDMVWFLETGLKRNGDDVQGLMSEVIEHGYKHLTSDDWQAIAAYIRSLRPIHNKVVAKKKPAAEQ